MLMLPRQLPSPPKKHGHLLLNRARYFEARLQFQEIPIAISQKRVIWEINFIPYTFETRENCRGSYQCYF